MTTKISSHQGEEKMPEEIPDLEIEKAVDEEQISKGDGKTMLILIGIIIGLLLLSLGGFRAYNYLTAAAVVNVDDLHTENLQGKLNEEEGYVYNGYSFVKADGLWWTEMNKFGTRLKVPLHFGPKEVESITVTGTLLPQFNDGDQIYVAIDPKVRDKYYSLAISELSFNVVKGMDRAPIGSCTEKDWACENRTIVSCTNNSENKPVVELALGEGEPTIHAIGACLKVTGKGYDIVKAVDRLLYKWYGIME